MEPHFETTYQGLRLRAQRLAFAASPVSAEVPDYSPPRCGVGVSHRIASAVVSLFRNTVSQVLARPSEWLELFKALRKRGAFFLRARPSSLRTPVDTFQLSPHLRKPVTA